MTVAIDYDGTMRRSRDWDPLETALWGMIVRLFRGQGHTVIICTMRSGHDADKAQIAKYQKLAGIDIPVVFMGEAPAGHDGFKKGACKAAGYNVDVWIDDMPEVCCPTPIVLNAQQGLRDELNRRLADEGLPTIHADDRIPPGIFIFKTGDPE